MPTSASSIPAAPPRSSASPVTGRITALWALAEVGLGGALHAFRLPVTGLFVGGSAVVLLSLLAEAARREGRAVRRTLLSRTAVVLGVKAAASPHAPLGAYLAVGFQGGLAALVLPVLGRRSGPLVLGAVALLESSLQRVLVLTLLFGTTFWEAVDALVGVAVRFFEGLTGLVLTPLPFSASYGLIAAYVGLHVVGGLVAGALAAWLPARAFEAAGQPPAAALARAARTQVEERVQVRARGRRTWWRRPVVRRLGLAVGLLGGYALLGGADGGSGPAVQAGVALLRAALLVGLWLGVVAPLGLVLVRRVAGPAWRGGAVDEAVAQLPQLRALARLAWVQSAGHGVRRPIVFGVLVVSAALVPTVSVAEEL
ncbi:MAG: hypothetical protein AAGI71_06060 [Bacteroidota bacterium]